jgi:hypothetical protein
MVPDLMNIFGHYVSEFAARSGPLVTNQARIM